jgi:hypothetical protein
MAPTTPTTSLTTSTTCCLLPYYKEKQINNTDLLEATDRVDLKLSEALTLVDSISNQSIESASTGHHGSTQPTCITQRERLDIDLTIIATLEGRIIHTRTVPRSDIAWCSLMAYVTRLHWLHIVPNCFLQILR